MTTVASIGEFAGCLYERPTPDGGTRDWRVDAATGARFPYDLTRSEIAGMRLSGVPIKIEHTTGEAFANGDEVGTVIDADTDPETGYTACKFALHDTIAGRTIARLIRGGALDSLSLGHAYDTATGAVDAKEVSVCFNGAREGTRLFKETSDFDRFKQVVASKRRVDVVATANTLAPPTTAAMDTGVPAQQQQQQAGAPGVESIAPGVESIAPGGAAVDQAQVVAASPVDASAIPPSAVVGDGLDEDDFTALLERATANAEENVATALYKRIAGIAEKMRAGEEINAGLLAEKEELIGQVQQTEKKNKEEASKVVSTMNALLNEFACGQTINCGLEQNQAQEAVFAAVPVLASAIHAHKNRATENNLETIRAGLAAEIRNALRGPSPWKDAAAPEVAVNASVKAIGVGGAEARPAQKRRMNEGLTPGQQAILSSLGSFGDAGRLTPDMLPSGYKGVKM